jgi:Uma2 family endonuclease
MASAPSPVSLEEYMRTSYSPDCEYIDGVVVERNVGQTKHAFTQGKVYRKIGDKVEARGLFVLPEQRVRVSMVRVRVPDVCVVAKIDKEVISEAPLLCVEILSPDDRWSRTNTSISDYHAMKVPCVWVVDPYGRRGWVFDLEQPPAEIGEDDLLRAEALDVEIRLSEVLPPADL